MTVWNVIAHDTNKEPAVFQAAEGRLVVTVVRNPDDAWYLTSSVGFNEHPLAATTGATAREEALQTVYQRCLRLQKNIGDLMAQVGTKPDSRRKGARA